MIDPDSTLQALQPRFLSALKLRNDGKVDAAMEILRGILLVEPRLAEPRLELARIYLDLGRLDDAEAEAREAIRILDGGGQWTDDVPEPVMQALAWATLGEVLKERASSDEVVFGPEATFRELLEQSRAAFARAHALDPSDTDAEIAALELGEGGARRKELAGSLDEDAIPDDDLDGDWRGGQGEA